MRTNLEDFNELGWTMIKNLISKTEISLIMNKISSINEAYDATVGTDKLKTRTALMLNSPETSRVVLDITKKEILESIFTSHNMRPVIEHTKILIKAIGGPATPWHQDSGYWRSFDPDRSMFTIWVALMDIGIENGCMRVLNTQNNLSELNHKAVHDESERAILDNELSVLLSQNNIVDCPLKAGDALIFKSWVVHSAYPNTSPLVRHAFKVVFQDLNKRPKKIPIPSRVVKLRGIIGLFNYWTDCAVTRANMRIHQYKSSFKAKLSRFLKGANNNA